MIGEGIIRWSLVVALGTAAFVTAGMGCSGAGGGSSGPAAGPSTSSGGGSSSGNGSGGSSSSSGGSGSGGGGSSSASSGGSGGGSTGGSSGGSSSGGGDGGVGMMEAGVPSKCPGYAVPPALGTTITLPATSSTMMEQVLPLGCMHLVSNRWTDPMAAETLFLNADSSFGWSWQRGNTGVMYSWGSPPNYPELEFGINPWGRGTPPVSTTDLLPMQLKNMHSASMTASVDTNIMQPGAGWNLAYEMWLAPNDPTQGTTNPEYEIMVFFGNAPNYYPTPPACDSLVNNVPCGQQVESGGNSYTLFYSNTQWAGPPAYNYLQFRDSANASGGTFSGTLDIYKFLQLVNPSGDLWVTRFELGAVWTQIATAFQSYGDHLIFECFNEPHGDVNGFSGGDAASRGVLNVYLAACMKAIRGTGGNNATRYVMVQGVGAQAVQASIQALVIPNDDPKILFSVHSYFPWPFSSGMTTTWGGAASDYTDLSNNVQQILGWLPSTTGIVMGEWGTVSADDLSSRVPHAAAYAQDMTVAGMAPIVWDDGGMAVLLNRNSNPPSWQYPTILSAIISGYKAGAAPGAMYAVHP